MTFFCIVVTDFGSLSLKFNAFNDFRRSSDVMKILNGSPSSAVILDKIAASESSVVFLKYLVIFGGGVSDIELDSPLNLCSIAFRFRNITSCFVFKCV